MLKLGQRFSPVTAVFLIVLVDVLGFTLILPLLPFYAEHFGASPLTIGLLLASFSLCQLISGPLFGRLSDRIGRKPLLIVSQIGTCLSFLLLAAAPNLTWVFIARLLDGATAGNISLAQATISDHTPPAERGQAFAKVGIAFGIGFLVGPALSGLLAGFGYAVPILTGAALSAMSIVATCLLLPAPKTPAAGVVATPELDQGLWASVFKRPPLRSRLLQFFTFIMAFAMYNTGIALFAGRRLTLNGQLFGPTQVAYLLAYGGFLGILIQGFCLVRLSRRFGEQALVAAGFAALATGLAILSLAHGLLVAMVAGTFIAAGHGLLRPTLTSLISQLAGRSQQGAILGVNQSLQSLAQILAPILGGALIEQHWEGAWAACAALFAACGLLGLRPNDGVNT